MQMISSSPAPLSPAVVPGNAPARAPRKKKIATAPPAPPAAKSLLDRVELGAKRGWSAGQEYGANAGTVATVAAFGHLGYAVGAAICPGATLLGLVVGIGMGALEERHVGVGQAVGGVCTGITGALYGGLANAIRREE